MLFWLFKGPNYNYGGYAKINEKTKSYSWLCRKAVRQHVYDLAEEVRRFLEECSDTLLPAIRKRYPAEAVRVETIYIKLMLLIYDLMIDSVVFHTEGDSWTSKKYEISGDGTTIREGIDVHSNYRTIIHKSSELCSEHKYQALVKGRQMLAEELRELDPSYSTKDNTWLYYKTDIEEIRSNICPIYDLSIDDLTEDAKRLNVFLKPEFIKIAEDLWGAYYTVVTTFGPWLKLSPFYKKTMKK